MAGLVEIYNLALSAATSRSSLSAVTENSREAEICNLWYPSVRDHVFRAAFWPCLQGTTSLAVIAERDFDVAWTAGDPRDPWRFAYSLPADIIRARYLTTYNRFELSLYTPSGKTPGEGSSRALLTNQPNAQLVYSVRMENTEHWDPDLVMSVVYGLAAAISNPLHGKRAIQADNLQRANEIIMAARLHSANEQERQHEAVPDWIAARGYYENISAPRYILPYGPLLGTSTQVMSGDV